MPGADHQGPHYRFAGFELEPRERRLLARGQPVTLTPKVFDTLVLLVERAGHVVSRDELMAALWPRGFVSDANLAKHIWAIRKALGGSCENDSRFIETVPKLGYRFIAPVECVAEVEPISSPAASGSTLAGLPSGVDGTDSGLSPHPVLHKGRGPALPDNAAAALTSPPARERRVADRRSVGRNPRASTASDHAYRRRKRWIAAAAVVAIAGVAAGLMWWRTQPPAGRVSPLAPDTVMAIVAFNNLSRNPQDAWLGPALTEMLATEVTATGRMRVLPAELLRPLRKNLPAPLAGGYAPASLAILRKRLGADYAISGSYLVSGTGTDRKLRLDLVLQDARTDVSIAHFSQSRSASGLLNLVASAGAALRAKLGLPAVPASAVRQLAEAQPPSADVARRIGIALDALHAYDPARARDELLLAVAEAPDYAPAYVLLSRAWSALGYHDKARAAIEQAAAHTATLPEVQRLRILAQQHVLAHDLSAAVADYQKLIALRPGDPEPRMQLVGILSDTGAALEEGAKALAAWRALPGAAGDPRWQRSAALLAQDAGDMEKALAHAQRAVRLARSRNAVGLLADAEITYASLLGQSDPAVNEAQAVVLAKQAIRDYQAMGNPLGVAHGYEVLAKTTWDSPQQQIQSYQRAMATYQQVGDLAGQARVYSALSGLLWHQGDADAAIAAVTHSIKLKHAVGDVQGEVWSTAGLLRMRADSSAGDAVLADYRKLLATEAHIGDVRIAVYTQANYADLLRERGELDVAHTTCAAAEKQADIKGSEAFLATIRLMCAGVARDRGDVAAARKLMSETARDPTSRSPRVALSSVIPLARIDIGRRDWIAARDLLEPWAAAGATPAQESARTTVSAEANALIALCYQALGNIAARDRTSKRGHDLRKRITERRTSFIVDVAQARLRGETGGRAMAVAKLRALAADADTRNWMASALEARLAAYQLLAQANDPTAGALHDTIESAARTHGFKWVLARLDKPTPATSVVAGN